MNMNCLLTMLWLRLPVWCIGVRRKSYNNRSYRRNRKLHKVLKYRPCSGYNEKGDYQGINELKKGCDVDVAIDCRGGEIMCKGMHFLIHGARWIIIVSIAGQKTEIDFKNIYVKNVRIV